MNESQREEGHPAHGQYTEEPQEKATSGAVAAVDEPQDRCGECEEALEVDLRRLAVDERDLGPDVLPQVLHEPYENYPRDHGGEVWQRRGSQVKPDTR